MSVYSATVGRDRISYTSQANGPNTEEVTLPPIPPEYRSIEHPATGVVAVHKLRPWVAQVGMELKYVRIQGNSVTVYGTGSPKKEHESVARVRLQIAEMQFLQEKKN